MTNGMIPCRNPKACGGVQSHRPGTDANCQATSSASGSQAKSSLSGGVPKLVTAHHDLPIHGDDVRELIAESGQLSHERGRLVGLATAQIESGIRKELNLSDRDSVIVNRGSLLEPIDRVTIHVSKPGQSDPTRYIERKSSYLPADSQPRQASIEDIIKLSEATADLNVRKAEALKQAKGKIESWVGGRRQPGSYDEVRTYPDNVIGVSESITAELYRSGDHKLTYNILRSEIFPE